MAFKNKYNWFFYGKDTKMLEEFTKKFTTKHIPYIQIENRFYLKNKQLDMIIFSNLTPALFGCYLGKIKGNTFHPSFGLLDILSEISKQKIIVNDRGEIDFLYGKHIRKKHVIEIKGLKEKGILKLVQNEQDENLGYGKFIGVSENKAQLMRHILDRGIFIKRDKNQIL